MSNAISQNTSALTPSLNGEESWDFASSAKRASDRVLSKVGITLARASVNRQALVDKCKNDYLSHFAMIYGKSGRLPTAIYEKIEMAVDQVIKARLDEVSPTNAVSYRKAFAFKANDLSFVHRITLTGENIIGLEEQHLAATIFITTVTKRLEDLYAKKTPNHDAEKACKAQLAKLEIAKSFIEGEISHQAGLAAAKT